MEKAETYPLASKDEGGRLLVAAATGAGADGVARAEALIAAGVDVIVVDTAHGHSAGVLQAVSDIRKLSNTTQIIGGNIATAEGAQALIDAGVDAVKVGIGPGFYLHHADDCRGWRAAANCNHGCNFCCGKSRCTSNCGWWY